MLAADKRLLESRVVAGAVRIKEKEFGVHHENLTTVGTQSAVIAGFSVAGLIKFHTHTEVSRALQFFYYVFVMCSLAASILCVANATMLSVCGTSLAMRGADGSMVRAVDEIYKLRKNVIGLFALGIVTFLIAAVFFVWIYFGTGEALLFTWLFAAVGISLVRMRSTTARLFYFPRSQSFSSSDLRSLVGPRV
mmetsp:Transcript_19288/g.57293  ORF Transcript_19288/g.57293 Transcript_19288/m.57293 type:complete len:193 (+) Transcript_19288:62-640(+)